MVGLMVLLSTLDNLNGIAYAELCLACGYVYTPHPSEGRLGGKFGVGSNAIDAPAMLLIRYACVKC